LVSEAAASVDVFGQDVSRNHSHWMRWQLQLFYHLLSKEVIKYSIHLFCSWILNKKSLLTKSPFLPHFSFH
jgi:hypothetical protein